MSWALWSVVGQGQRISSRRKLLPSGSASSARSRISSPRCSACAATGTWQLPSTAINTPRSLAVVSATWLVLTVAFEFLFGHYVDGKPWPALAANYQVWNGALWPFVLIALVGTPFLWARPLDPPNPSPVPPHG